MHMKIRKGPDKNVQQGIDLFTPTFTPTRISYRQNDHSHFPALHFPAAQPQPRPSMLRRATSGPSGLCRWQRRVSGLYMCHHHTSVRWLHRRSTLISCSPMTSAVARHAFVRDAAGTLLRVWCTRLLGLRAHAMVLSSASDNASAPDPQECTSSIVLLAPCVGP